MIDRVLSEPSPLAVAVLEAAIHPVEAERGGDFSSDDENTNAIDAYVSLERTIDALRGEGRAGES